MHLIISCIKKTIYKIKRYYYLELIFTIDRLMEQRENTFYQYYYEYEYNESSSGPLMNAILNMVYIVLYY